MPFIATNPATEEVISEYPVFDAPDEVDRALERATTAYPQVASTRARRARRAV